MCTHTHTTKQSRKTEQNTNNLFCARTFLPEKLLGSVVISIPVCAHACACMCIICLVSTFFSEAHCTLPPNTHMWHAVWCYIMRHYPPCSSLFPISINIWIMKYEDLLIGPSPAWTYTHSRLFATNCISSWDIYPPAFSWGRILSTLSEISTETSDGAGLYKSWIWGWLGFYHFSSHDAYLWVPLLIIIQSPIWSVLYPPQTHPTLHSVLQAVTRKASSDGIPSAFLFQNPSTYCFSHQDIASSKVSIWLSYHYSDVS